MQSGQHVQVKIQPERHHVDQMREFFKKNPYWEQDVWDVYDEDFPLDLSGFNYRNRTLKFDNLSNSFVKYEIKYYLASRLLDGSISLSGVLRHYGAPANELNNFFCEMLPTIHSIIEIQYNKTIIHYRTYLISKGRPIVIEAERDGKQRVWNTPYIGLFRQIYEFYYYDFYDDREETEKDIWDIRKLGIEYNITTEQHSINFTQVPTVFRELAKRYIKLRLITLRNLSPSKCRSEYMNTFLTSFATNLT